MSNYYSFVENVKRLAFKKGVPTYIIAQQIGISDKTLRRFFDKENVGIYIVLTIAEYYKINIFGKFSEKVD